MRKGYKKGETKLTDILKLTENILVRDGYAGLSMRKVAREMGITAGNLQYYFATKDELIDYAIRTGAPLEVVENLQSMEEEAEEVYESIEEIWPDYPTDEDYLWNEDEY